MVGGRETLRAWTVMDELVLEVFAMTRRHSAEIPEDLPAALRGVAVRAALKIVQGLRLRGAESLVPLRSALGILAELRYYLYLARRLGLIDLRRYRGACARHERVQVCLREILADRARAQSPAEPEAAPEPNGPSAGGLSFFEDDATAVSGTVTS